MNSLASLRVRILLPLMAAVAGILVLSFYNSYTARSLERNQAQMTALRLATHIAVDQEQYITDARQVLELLEALEVSQLLEGGQRCNALLADIRRDRPQFANIGVIDREGRVTCSAIPFDSAIRLDHRDYYRRAIEHESFSLGDYQIGVITGRGSINAGYPLRDQTGVISRVLFVALDLSWLSQTLAKITLPNSTFVSLVAGDGTILTRYPDDGLIGTPFGEGYASFELPEDEKGVGDFVNDKGEGRLFASVPLPDWDGQSPRVIVSIGGDEAYGEVDEVFVRQIVGLIIVALLVAFASWYWSRRLVIHPIEALTNASREMNAGNFSARAQLISPIKEIADLASSFDDMADTLEARYDQIASQDRELVRVNRALETLSAGNHALLRAVDESKLLDDMCQTSVAVGGYKASWVGYAIAGEEWQIKLMAVAGIDDDLAKGLPEVLKDQAINQTSTAYAIKSGKSIVNHKIQSNSISPYWKLFFNKLGVFSSISLPLVVEGQVIGVFVIYSGDTDAFDSREQTILAEMSQDLAFGLKSIRMREQKERAEAELRHLAYHDPVTDLPNYRQMQLWLDEALNDNKAGLARLALVNIGLDRLQEINSTLGVDIANRLLKETAVEIIQQLLPGEKIARLQNAEIAILVPDASPDIAETRARTLVDAVNRQRHLLEGFTLTVHAKAGIVMHPDHGMTSSELLQETGTALQLARDAGDEYVFYSPKVDKDKKYLLGLAGKLHEALENYQLQLYYQPKICMATGRVLGLEALARWRHPDNGMIPPDVFIAVAESTGLINRLSQWVVEKALDQIRVWRNRNIRLPVAINLSPHDIHNKELIQFLQAKKEKEELAPDMLEIEITERAIVADPDDARKQLSILREMGIMLYVDDFGTGFSSLATLKKLPFNAIKIDKSFVIDMLGDPDAQVIVRSTIQLAVQLNLSVVAEGVETEAVWNTLKEWGCDSAQGYYMAKPMTSDDLENWLRESPWGWA